jgi:hypothetical protein
MSVMISAPPSWRPGRPGGLYGDVGGSAAGRPPQPCSGRLGPARPAGCGWRRSWRDMYALSSVKALSPCCLRCRHSVNSPTNGIQTDASKCGGAVLACWLLLYPDFSVKNKK